MKKFYLILITLFLGINNVFASTNTIPRTEEDLGVNKKWTINEKNIGNVKRTPRVNASEKIYDFANIISDEEEQKLYQEIKNYIDYTKMDMVILTIDLELNDSEIEDYAADFYDYNDFGIDTPKYDGIILVRNANNYNRFFNIYTFGEAQLYYDYDTCERILDYIFDDIKNNRYLSGFSKFISSSKSYFDKGPRDDWYVDDYGYVYVKREYHIPWKTSIIISSIVTLITIIILVKKNKMVKKETLANVYINKDSIYYRNKVDQFLHSHTSSYTISSSSSSGGGGGSHSHSGSSGGGHGGGGGRHG